MVQVGMTGLWKRSMSPLGYYLTWIKCDAGDSLDQILYNVVKEPGLYVLENVETGESRPCIAK